MTATELPRGSLRDRLPGWALPSGRLGNRLPHWAAALLLGGLCLFVYNANLRTIGSGDTLPARYLPLLLWHAGTLDFDSSTRLVAHGHHVVQPHRRGGESLSNDFPPDAYWLVRTRSGHLASPYPVVAPLLAAPLYLPAALVLNSEGWTQPNIDRVAEIAEKLAASIFATLASLLLFSILRRERNRWAVPLALAFAFGTDTWMISSQALWQHGSGELLVTLGLRLTLARASPLRTGALGFVCVLIAANRQPDVLIAAALALAAIWNRKRDVGWLAGGAALPLAALLYYNLVFIGNLVGGYELAGGEVKAHFFRASLLGLPGLLVSPAKGLLVFSPFLVFLPAGLARRLRVPDVRLLTLALGAAVVGEVLICSQADWRAGVSWGPRWLTDLLPLMLWMLAPAPLVLRSRARGVLAVLMVAAVGIQAVGAFWYQHTSDERILANPASMSAAWDPGNAPFVQELGHPPASFELACSAHGSIDVPPPLAATRGVVPELRAGTAIQGWALACGRTPAQVVLLIDGRVVGEATSFFVRPDVNRALHVTAASGWSVPADTSGLIPGRHVLQLAVRVAARSDVRIVREEPVVVTPPPSLQALAAVAAQRLRADQARAGYWLTDYTSLTQYLAPHPEMNTYLTSILVDLLAPIAPKLGLDGVVVRARRELASQIESDGLVRYHGLPSGPTIGTLGCVITPDADDTALVWRIAGKAGDPRLQPMLRTLARYRDGRGLYRTWLAPQSRYQCLDPGRDPDPADIGIQMHLYMMFRGFDPAAAQPLCTAMQRWAGADSVWVYYAQAPLIPYLRSAQLGQLGCPLALPTARLARSIPGQEWWAAVARLLVQTGAAPPDATTGQAIRSLLEQLGENGFGVLRAMPPLVFQNDPTASVKRFYWSRDAGYALWLRLYETATLGAR